MRQFSVMMSASLLVACLVSVAVATPYIVVNDFKCTPGGCASRATNTVRLALANSSQQRLLLQLVPPSTNLEAAETAWDPASRTFFTLLIDQTTGGGTLFSQRLNNNLTTGTLIAAVNVSLPAAAGGIVSFSVAGGVPLLLGQFGLVARVNPLTGSVVASFQAYSNTSLYLVGVSASTGGACTCGEALFLAPLTARRAAVYTGIQQCGPAAVHPSGHQPRHNDGHGHAAWSGAAPQPVGQDGPVQHGVDPVRVAAAGAKHGLL